jgi:hypothetical protein
LATIELRILFPGPALASVVVVAWLTMGIGDVLNASSEGFDPERPFKQSWVRMTREPSAQRIDAIREAIVETEGTIKVKLGTLAVKLLIVDGGGGAAELDLKVLAIAQFEWYFRTAGKSSSKSLDSDK